eukprot:TRINITY_DN8834_c0_g1_i1.p1 TRINITY_DN8834_c0_g1~~TRINITY_DN8834_c0_g1_i1.p1  ORF type:complete len:1029 (-),score=232.31 TRINITY_DN8834_c0_g1_i1:21-3107(-)
MEPLSKKRKLDTGTLENDESKQYENEYSRLLGVVGKEALGKLQTSRVLLVGLTGLGSEIAKNIILMGVKEVVIHDTDTVKMHHLSSQFYLSEKNLGENIAQASLQGLSGLNPRVAISVNNEDLTDDFIKELTVVVITSILSISELVRINELCRTSDTVFIVCNIWGLFGWVFTDFGENFLVTDKDGETPKHCYIESISKNIEGVVTTALNTPHNLEDGDIVLIRDVEGMDQVNGNHSVTVKNANSFMIGDTTSFDDYKKGGEVIQQKIPFQVSHASLGELISDIPLDKINVIDWGKYERLLPEWCYILAILDYYEKNSTLPTPGYEKDANDILNLTRDKYREIVDENWTDDLDELIIKFAKCASGEISPMSSVFGGIVGQEIIKAASSKYTPLDQVFIFDSIESLPDYDLSKQECAPLNSRYDGYISVFGRQFHQKLRDLNYFLVGCGAIGCEVLKCWSMIGIGSGNGSINVTDMDTIEISNLNRQLLYRPKDIAKFKSEAASEYVKSHNNDLNIRSWCVKVGPETEDTFNEEFWNNLDGVCNALDNIHARLYIDDHCVSFRKPLLESGTLGTKGNVQVIIPDLTESYGDSTDPPETETPLCILHSFPHNIEHCLQWGREIIFEEYFVDHPNIVKNYLEDPNYISKQPPMMKKPALETLSTSLLNKETSFKDCIVWARYIFEDCFSSKLKQLLFTFPLDYVDKDGVPFWSGTKKPPTPVVFDIENQMHLNFIVSATFLRAYTLNLIEYEEKPEDLSLQIDFIKNFVSTVQVPEFRPKEGAIINTDETIKKSDNDPTRFTDQDDMYCESVLEVLPPIEEIYWRPNPIIFDKDNDNNFHIDCITSAGNIRASAYGIETVDRLQSKIIAGRIVPAILTTTATIVGLANLELFKIVNSKPIEGYRNSFLNLGLPLIQQSEPFPPPKVEGKDFTRWDRIDVKEGDITVNELIQYFKKNHNCNVDILGVGSGMIYCGWLPKYRKNLRKKVSDLAREILGDAFDESSNSFHIIPDLTDDSGNPIVLPKVIFWFQN